MRHLAGDPGQSRPESEHLGRRPAQPVAGGVGEPEERIGVRRHGPADVDEQHDPTWPATPLLKRQLGRLATGMHQALQGAPTVDRPAPRRATASRPAPLPRQCERRQQPREYDAIGRGHAGDISMA